MGLLLKMSTKVILVLKNVQMYTLFVVTCVCFISIPVHYS